MVTGILIGVAGGVVLGLLVAYLISPGLMFRQDSHTQDFDTVVEKIDKVVQQRGWKIPHVHDLQATMQKFGKEVRSVKVFEICHPDHSYEILSRDDEKIVSNMMPCRIAVYEKEDGSVWISRMNTGLMARPMSKVTRRTMSAAAGEVEEIIAEVLGE
jgi:uncharacterized protein (DUF302 family)